ncbi:hypothetical protein I553_4258 [Mycobacterium xenopi 4042]|uniref:Uncharacterized protein n=1 Tax=Mycobacterium xenopi 4042 TaxID=1299334 RepID=X8AG55_MYCXE|nr:hypothetical protein I553_4258 [Mycobacterium xenopi 4042]
MHRKAVPTGLRPATVDHRSWGKAYDRGDDSPDQRKPVAVAERVAPVISPGPLVPVPDFGPSTACGAGR